MLAPQSVEHFPCRLRASGFHVGQPSLKALDGLHAIEKVLVGFGIPTDSPLPSSSRPNEWRVSWVGRADESRLFLWKSMRVPMSFVLSRLSAPTKFAPHNTGPPERRFGQTPDAPPEPRRHHTAPGSRSGGRATRRGPARNETGGSRQGYPESGKPPVS